MKRLFIDLSLTVQTAAGSAVYAWEICHRLMRLGQPMQVLPMTNPFRTQGRFGWKRQLNGLLRDVLWRPWLAGSEARDRDCFLFTNAFVPRSFLHREFGVIMLDLAAWHDREILSWRGRLGMHGLPQTLRRASKIFAISEYTAEDVAQTFSIPAERIRLAPCGLSDNFREHVTGEGRRRPKAPSMINGRAVPEQYILHVGSLEPKKNILFLLRVFACLRERPFTNETGAARYCKEHCKLVLTGGEAWQDDALCETIAEHPYAQDIIQLGQVAPEDLPGLYQNAAALVFPSTHEGFGLPVIEALSQGTPVLVQANSALTQFGAYGATVMPDFDAEAWVEQLLEILAAQNRISSEQVQAVNQVFNWDLTAQVLWQAMMGGLGRKTSIQG